jgi:hypothetical protein
MATATKKTRKLKSLKHIKKLSSLLALALRDVRKQERAKNSVVEMGVWLRQNGKCLACAAGSVMRFSLSGKHYHPSQYDAPTKNRLYAINELREGWCTFAAQYLGTTSRLPYRQAPEYDGPRGEWWKAMRKLLADLKAAGE